MTVKERVGKVETFSNYSISPLRKRYDVFFRSTMCAFKAIRCWLRTNLTNEAPKGWDKKRKEIDEKILKLVRLPKQEAVIEEIDIDEASDNKDESENNRPSITINLGRLDIRSRHDDACKALEYNILRRDGNDEIQLWKSYPGVNEIIKGARNVIENHDKKNIDELVNMMKVHESQQSAAVVSTIAVLVGGTLKNEVSKETREAIGDIILWDVPVIKEKEDWPQRKRYSTKIIY